MFVSASTATRWMVLAISREQLNTLLGRVPDAHPDVEGWGAWLPAWFWLPWGIALAVATYAYYRRRVGSRRVDRIRTLAAHSPASRASMRRR